MIASLTSVNRLTQRISRQWSGALSSARTGINSCADSLTTSGGQPTPGRAGAEAQAASGEKPSESSDRSALPDHVPPLGQLDQIYFDHNRSTSFRRIENLAAVLRQADPASALRITRVASQLKLQFDDGKQAARGVDLLPAFRPQNLLAFSFEHYQEAGDHAKLVARFAEATEHQWDPQEIESRFDEDLDKWVVRFKEDEQHRQWRFRQDNGWLNPGFLEQLTRRAEFKSGHRLVPLAVPLEESNPASAISLPFGLYQRLINDELLLPIASSNRFQEPARQYQAEPLDLPTDSKQTLPPWPNVLGRAA